MTNKQSLPLRGNKNCPVCNKLKPVVFWAQKGYPLARCRYCGMVWDYQYKQEEISQYEELYFKNDNPKGGYANYFDGMAINKKTFSDRLKKIENRLGKKGKLLDVGCALGDCLLMARSLGWKEIEGIELSKYAANFARKRGLKITQGTLFTHKFKANSYDAITLFDVIEHVSDPIDQLKQIKRLLKPGGIVLMVTPDIGGFWSWLLRSGWYHYKPGEHLLYFTQSTISTALQKTGFKNIKTAKTYHVMSLEYILNRLRFYYPLVFTRLLSLISKTRFKNIPFRVYAGELEAWGEK